MGDQDRKRWWKFYAVAIPVVGLVAWLEWGVHPVRVLLGMAVAGLLTFLYVKGWLRGGGGDGG